MIVLFYFDWLGSTKELKELEKIVIAAAAREGSIKSEGMYAPDGRKFHFVSMFETESFERLMSVLMDPKNPP